MAFVLEAYARDASSDTFVESIRSMREAGHVPDLSEPTNNPHGGVSAGVVDVSEPAEPDAPRFEDYRHADGKLDGEAYLPTAPPITPCRCRTSPSPNATNVSPAIDGKPA